MMYQVVFCTQALLQCIAESKLVTAVTQGQQMMCVAARLKVAIVSVQDPSGQDRSSLTRAPSKQYDARAMTSKLPRSLLGTRSNEDFRRNQRHQLAHRYTRMQILASCTDLPSAPR
ncbi:TPA: hypothetical protein ACH3X1_004527 [Trebouxia sp. C0004]